MDRHRDGRNRERTSEPPPTLAPREAAQAGLEQVVTLTGQEAQGVVSLEPAEAGWVVGVEVVEDRRIPSSSDILALYEVEIDQDGELVAYTRKRRYPRGKFDTGE